MCFRSLSAPLMMIFVLGIFTTRTHPVGVVVGSISSQLILGIKILSRFYFPEPADITDLTLRNNTLCTNSTGEYGRHFSPLDGESDYPIWHKMFWISDIGWTQFYAMLLMAIPCKWEHINLWQKKSIDFLAKQFFWRKKLFGERNRLTPVSRSLGTFVQNSAPKLFVQTTSCISFRNPWAFQFVQLLHTHIFTRTSKLPFFIDISMILGVVEKNNCKK